MTDHLRMGEEHMLLPGTVTAGVMTRAYFSNPDSDSDKRPRSEHITVSPLGFTSCGHERSSLKQRVVSVIKVGTLIDIITILPSAHTNGPLRSHLFDQREQ